MNFWNKLKRDVSNRAKAPILRELDRAIDKIRNGDTAGDVVATLRGTLTSLLTGKLPPIIGAILLDVVLAKVNWEELADKQSGGVLIALQRIRRDVEGARL